MIYIDLYYSVQDLAIEVLDPLAMTYIITMQLSKNGCF